MRRTPSRSAPGGRSGSAASPDPSSPPSLSPDEAVRLGATLRAIGLPGAARDVVAGSAPGSLSGNAGPATIAESLGRMPDAYRTMILHAARGDRDYRNQALATMGLWWPELPTELRHNLEVSAEQWRREHGHGEPAERARRLDMFLPKVRGRNAGIQKLGVAMRMG